MKLVTAIIKPFKLDDVRAFRVLPLPKLRVLAVKKATRNYIAALNTW